MEHRVYNFSAGPAALPLPVLESAQKELLNFGGCGMSVMELSHRSKTFRGIYNAAVEDLRTLMDIPENYRILFLQGGGTLRFSMVPLNLMVQGKADYILSGAWSEKAWEEGRKFGSAQVIASSRDIQFTDLPDLSSLPIREDADYVYICENETIHGTAYAGLPDTKGKPFVSDQSSMFLSKPCKVSDYGLIFAGVQKNVGPAGMAVVIIREDLIRKDPDPAIPTYLRYDVHSRADSMYNTPNCWSIYLCGKVFRYLLDQGGLSAMETRNREKAKFLYDYLDSSRLFHGIAQRSHRSLMNIPFTSGFSLLDSRVIQRCREAGLVELTGHRSLGGLRASLYNAMPLEGVKALVACLESFEKELPQEGISCGS